MTRKNNAGSVVQCVLSKSHLGEHLGLGGEWPNQGDGYNKDAEFVVSHERARSVAAWHLPDKERTILARYVDQQEQTEHEAVELKALLLEARGVLVKHIEQSTAWDDERHALRKDRDAERAKKEAAEHQRDAAKMSLEEEESKNAGLSVEKEALRVEMEQAKAQSDEWQKTGCEIIVKLRAENEWLKKERGRVFYEHFDSARNRLPVQQSAEAAPVVGDPACYCSDRMSGGLPCPPGRCPNVPTEPEQVEAIEFERDSKRFTVMVQRWVRMETDPNTAWVEATVTATATDIIAALLANPKQRRAVAMGLLAADNDAEGNRVLEMMQQAARALTAEAELAKVTEDARRMHYLGNIIRSRTQIEQDELTRLMRKYPPLAAAPPAVPETVPVISDVLPVAENTVGLRASSGEDAGDGVAHQRALQLLEHHEDSLPSSSAVLRKYVHQQQAKQEQSEREAAEGATVRRLLAEARDVMRSDRDAERAQKEDLQRQVVAACDQREALRVELEATKSTLAIATGNIENLAMAAIKNGIRDKAERDALRTENDALRELEHLVRTDTAARRFLAAPLCKLDALRKQSAEAAPVKCWSCGATVAADYKKCGKCNQEPDNSEVAPVPLSIDAEAQAILDDSKANALRCLPQHICNVIVRSPKDDPLWVAVRGALIGLGYAAERPAGVDRPVMLGELVRALRAYGAGSPDRTVELGRARDWAWLASELEREGSKP